MDEEHQMSLTKYLLIKDKLIPKHLSSNDHQRKKDIIRKQILAESPVEIIQKAKQKYLRPIGQIETIMNHFDSKFNNRKVSLRESVDRPRKKKGSSMVTEGNSTQRQLKSKMAYLLNLPFIGTAKKEAEKYRSKLHSQKLKEKEEKKLKIMEQFSRYMQAELRGNPKPSLARRANTIH